MTTPPTLTVTHTSTVTDDQIDELGHMNVRYYGMNAVAATQSMTSSLGCSEAALLSAYTRHHNEQLVGASLEVRSALAASDDRLRLYHELRNQADGQLAATFVHELDCPRLEAPTIELPEHGRPRSLRLSTNGLADAPPLQELIDRGLATRKPRRVSTDDTLGAPAVPTWLANNLIWGGERLDGDDDWIRTLPNGDRYAYVVMETRLWVRSEPVLLDTPLQSFSATLDMGTKIMRDISWSYNTETGEPLAVIEGIDLCFNMNERRSMEIPDDARALRAPHLFPELAPA